jgi:hypothetical protein
MPPELKVVGSFSFGGAEGSQVHPHFGPNASRRVGRADRRSGGFVFSQLQIAFENWGALRGFGCHQFRPTLASKRPRSPTRPDSGVIRVPEMSRTSQNAGTHQLALAATLLSPRPLTTPATSGWSGRIPDRLGWQLVSVSFAGIGAFFENARAAPYSTWSNS